MTDRIIKFFGKSYVTNGSSPINVTVNFDQTLVYTGPIPSTDCVTVDNDVIERNMETHVALFLCKWPAEFAGTIAVSIQFDCTGSGMIYFQQILANCTMIKNRKFTAHELKKILDPDCLLAEKISIWIKHALPPLTNSQIIKLQEPDSQEKQKILDMANLTPILKCGPWHYLPICPGHGDPKSNVVINGVPQNKESDQDLPGDWGYEIPVYPNITSTINFDLLVAPGHSIESLDI